MSMAAAACMGLSSRCCDACETSEGEHSVSDTKNGPSHSHMGPRRRTVLHAVASGVTQGSWSPSCGVNGNRKPARQEVVNEETRVSSRAIRIQVRGGNR